MSGPATLALRDTVARAAAAEPDQRVARALADVAPGLAGKRGG